jgi:surface protein
MSYMFCGCDKLKELNLSSFNTSKTKNMCFMFGFCAGLKELDLSNFVILNDTEDNLDVESMFSFCENLTTIYAAAGTDWGSIENISSGKMFFGCDSLKGGNNTVYHLSKTDKTYARIDGLDGKPGYFTVTAAATE